jgi:phage tail-like protein
MVAVPVPDATAAQADNQEPAPREEILAPHLPAVLRQDPFLSSFLQIFDSVLRPVLDTVGAIDSYFDPGLVPSRFLEWLGGWVGEGLDDRLPEDAWRTFIAEAAELHRARGTRVGLKRAIEIAASAEPLIIENTGGLRLDVDARLGLNTTLNEIDPNSLHITLPAKAAAYDLELIGEVVRRFKPAHATYSIRTTEA